MSRSFVSLALLAALLFGFLAVDTQGCSGRYYDGGEKVVCVEFDIDMYGCKATGIEVTYRTSQDANKTRPHADASYCYLSYASLEKFKIGHGIHTCSCPGPYVDEIVRKCKEKLLHSALRKIEKGRCPDLEQEIGNLTREITTAETTLITNTTSTRTVTTAITTRHVQTSPSSVTTSTITPPAITMNSTVEAVTPTTGSSPPRTTRSRTSVGSFGTTSKMTMATTLARMVSTTPAYRNNSGVVVSRLDKEQIRAERKRLLYRTKLRLLIISVIMTTVLTIQFFLIGQLRRYLRKDHADRMNLRKFARRGEKPAPQKSEYVSPKRERGDELFAMKTDRLYFMNELKPSSRPAKIEDYAVDYYKWEPTEPTSKEGSSKTSSREYLNSKEDGSRKLSIRHYHEWKATEPASKEGSSKTSSKEHLNSKKDVSRKTSKSKHFGSAESV